MSDSVSVTKEDLLGMELHRSQIFMEQNSLEQMIVTRVVGGWVYRFQCADGTGAYDMTSCFVPEPQGLNIGGVF